MEGFGDTLREFGVKISLAFDKKKAEETQEKIEKMAQELSHFSLEVAAAAAAIFEFGNLASSNARHLQESSELLGINVENLQELAYAAKVAAGVNREELVGSLEAVSATMDKARHGDVMASEGLLRLAQAGVGTDKMLKMLQDRGTTSEQVMIALSESFKNIKDPLAAARLATEAFGGAGAKLLPFLKKGPEGIAALRREGRGLGVIISEKTIEQAAEMDRQFTRMYEVLKSIGYTIGFELLKYMKPLAQEFLTWVGHNKKLIAMNIVVVLKEIAEIIRDIVGVARALAPALSFVNDKLGGTKETVKLAIDAFLAMKVAAWATTPAVGGLATSLGALALELGPLLAIAAAIHEIHNAMTGDVEHTLMFKLNEGLDKLANGDFFSGGEENKGTLAEKFAAFHAKQAAAQAASGMSAVKSNSPLGAYGVGNGAANETPNEYTMNTTINVSVPAGTSAAAATSIVSNAASQSHDRLMQKTKMDALRNRQY